MPTTANTTPAMFTGKLPEGLRISDIKLIPNMPDGVCRKTIKAARHYFQAFKDVTGHSVAMKARLRNVGGFVAITAERLEELDAPRELDAANELLAEIAEYLGITVQHLQGEAAELNVRAVDLSLR